MKFPFMLRRTHEELMKPLEFEIDLLKTSLRHTIARQDALQDALAQSRKNDSPRDPKTGRFVKKD